MVIEKARELGMALCESQEFKEFMDAKRALEANAALSHTMEEYNSKRDELAGNLEDESFDPSRAEALSHDMENLQGTLLASELFTNMLSAQSNFALLMKRVNKVIGACVGFDTETDDADECGGHCDGCAGCKH